MRLPLIRDAPLVRLSPPPEAFNDALHCRLCTVTSAAIVIVALVSTPLIRTSSSAVGRALLVQLLASLQETPSPPPVQ